MIIYPRACRGTRHSSTLACVHTSQLCAGAVAGTPPHHPSHPCVPVRACPPVPTQASFTLAPRPRDRETADEPGPGAFEVGRTQLDATRRRQPASSLHIDYNDRKGLLQVGRRA
eukprot:COSAG01_NODE_33_length_35013_cov_86.824144_32_plen_114_part_00